MRFNFEGGWLLADLGKIFYSFGLTVVFCKTIYSVSLSFYFKERFLNRLVKFHLLESLR